MIHPFKICVLGLITFLSVSNASAQSECTSFTGPSKAQYLSTSATSGIKKAEFDEVLAKIDRLYRPVFTSLGGTLSISADWESSSVDARAFELAWSWMVSFSGGLARQPSMTRDAFALVACHEIGHHLGGAPRMILSPLSSEGEADYYATLKCARQFFADEDNLAALKGIRIDKHVIDECRASFATQNERLICVRSAAASLTIIKVLQTVNSDRTVVSFRTPDSSEPWVFSNPAHPAAQCRLDTFFNGSRCTAPASTPLSVQSYETGSCDVNGQGPNRGSRPRCWFKP